MQLYVNINGVRVNVENAFTVLQICNLIGIYIPRFCYHEKLSIVGSCRMCLVEMYKALKPIVACATPILNGMDIYTETILIKNSREHILEFLLINHPLDCPICDQGSECDLQDQALIYGSDRGRFKEKKRSIIDKEFGPFIKTIMTRCIHCTRCIRFMSEIAHNTVLGTLHRGVDTEIGTYINMIIRSEISGNIIDICPVGALTSKPYAFVSRSWDLRSTESIDIFDGLGSSIRLDFRGSEIVRILPSANESINEQWITDKVRFTYDGFKYRRVTTPLIKCCDWFNLITSNIYCNISWEYIIQLLIIIFTYYILLYNGNNIYFNIGELVDFNTVFSINKILGLFGLSNINYYFPVSVNNINIDSRENYILNRPIVHFEHAGLYIFIGSNLQLESPLLNIRLFRKISNRKLFGFFGSFLKNISTGYQLGISTISMLRFIEGRHTFCKVIFNCYDILWITNINNMYKQQNLFVVLNILFKTTNKLQYHGLLHLDCTLVGILDSGIVPKYKKLTKYIQIFNMNKFIYNINCSDISSNIFDYSIYQGSHSVIKNFEKINIFLPSTTFVEKTESYVNTEGRLLLTKMAIVPPGLSKNDSDILNIFTMIMLFQNFNFFKLIKQSLLYIHTPYLYYIHKWRTNMLYYLVWLLIYTLYMNNNPIIYLFNMHNTIYMYTIDNYYVTNIINTASKILTKMIVVLSNYFYKY